MKARIIPSYAAGEAVRVYTSAGWLRGRVEYRVSAKTYHCWVEVETGVWAPMDCPISSFSRGWPPLQFPYSAWEMQHTTAGREWWARHRR